MLNLIQLTYFKLLELLNSQGESVLNQLN